MTTISKIDAYKAAKDVVSRATRYFRVAIGLDPETGKVDTGNDKHMLCLFSGGPEKSTALSLHSRYGYFGNSSCYEAITGDLVPYFVRAANMHMREIALQAIELAKNDAEKARLAAEDEAREVLRETAAT